VAQLRPQAAVTGLEVAAYRIPTDGPEADGTLAWNSTTLVAVHASAGGERGFGYTYSSAAAARLVRESLVEQVVGKDAFATEASWLAMVGQVRNAGRPGIASTAISAVDAALWDLKARLLGVPLVSLLGAARDEVEVYGSGGFTSASVAALCAQLVGWAERQGCQRVKMKVGSKPEEDLSRVEAARKALPASVELMVDANGAYRLPRAVEQARAFASAGVRWFEEPVSSDDLEGLRHVRDRAPAGLAVAAGEYGYDPWYFRRMLEARAVDVLQADASRCLGVTGFIAASRLAQAFGLPLSGHTAPSLHLHLGCACAPVVHLEYFHDHARIESLLFDGFIAPVNGKLAPDHGRPGFGVELKEQDAARYAV
jgi:L-alanine-DL-glutamate epimerase-like enolase superfamily enzyme